MIYLNTLKISFFVSSTMRLASSQVEVPSNTRLRLSQNNSRRATWAYCGTTILNLCRTLLKKKNNDACMLERWNHKNFSRLNTDKININTNSPSKIIISRLISLQPVTVAPLKRIKVINRDARINFDRHYRRGGSQRPTGSTRRLQL